MNAPTTILVVAMGASVHAARWLNMVRAPDLRFVLLPIYEADLAPSLDAWRPVETQADVAGLAAHEVGVFRPSADADADCERLNADIGYRTWRPSFMPESIRFAQPFHLADAIRRFRPGLVHSLEVQMAGYLCLATHDHLGAAFPRWLLSNWGSDIFLYRKIDDHRARLTGVARSIDAYLAECRRDVALVRQLGFRGTVLPPIPASGGMVAADVPRLDALPPPSARREILVKGYHGWSGRGLHIPAALRIAAPALAGYTIHIILAGPELRLTAAALAEETGLDIVCDPYLSSHAEALDRLGRARMTIGFGISDGISTTLLEAMTMGSLPIQADTSCGDEWIEHGRTGMLVSPHDIAGLADAIERAATDDALVDAAAVVNRATVEARWRADVNGPAMVEHYRALLAADRATALSGTGP